MIELHKVNKRLTIDLIVIPMGQDICIVVTGGDTPHLGSITSGSKAVSPETFSFESHKEGIVTEMMSCIIRERFDGNFVICCGIHVDNITIQEIKDVNEICRLLAIELCEKLKSTDHLSQ